MQKTTPRMIMRRETPWQASSDDEKESKIIENQPTVCNEMNCQRLSEINFKQLFIKKCVLFLRLIYKNERGVAPLEVHGVPV